MNLASLMNMTPSELLGMKKKLIAKINGFETIFWLFSQNLSFKLKKALYEDIGVY